MAPLWFDRPAAEALDVVLNADRLGFDDVWIGEMRTFDAFALAGAAAARTRRVRIVCGPLAVGVRTPASLALGMASVTTIGGREAGLALGASTPLVVSGWHGRAWRHTADRMRETVESLRPVLAGERSSYTGKYVRTGGFRLHEPPAACEISVAAFGPAMLRTAARVADRVVVNLLTPAQVSRVAETLADECGGAAPPLTAWVPAALDPGAEALAQLRRQLVAYVGAPGYGEMFAEAGFGTAVDAARSASHPREVLASIPDELVASVSALGSADDVCGTLDEYYRAGADVAVVPVTAGDDGAARVLGAVAGHQDRVEKGAGP